MTAHPLPPEATLLDLIELDRRWRLEDWWADFLAKCAARKSRRERSFSARSRKSAETKHNRMMAGHPILLPDRVGANFRCAETASLGLRPEPRTASRPSGEHRISQEVQKGE